MQPPFRFRPPLLLALALAVAAPVAAQDASPPQAPRPAPQVLEVPGGPEVGAGELVRCAREVARSFPSPTLQMVPRVAGSSQAADSEVISSQRLGLLPRTQAGHAADASGGLEVPEAQRTLRQVQTVYLQALAGARTQQAALEGALGSAPTSETPGALSHHSGSVSPLGTAAPGTQSSESRGENP